MRAQYVNENIRFERSQDPKYSMGIGDWSIKRALLDIGQYPVGSMQYDANKEWWENGGIPEEFKNEIGYSGDPDDFVGFDEDYYIENELPENIEEEDFYSDITPVGKRKSKPNTNGWGVFQWQKNKLSDGSVVYHYVDGMGSGFMARRDQLK